MNKLFFLFCLFLLPHAHGAEAVRCGGKLYSLEYVVAKGKSPINGNLFTEGSIGTGTMVLTSYLLATIQRTHPSYNQAAAYYIQNILNESDTNAPFLWKKSKLGFPIKEVKAGELNLDASCFTNGKASIYEVVRYSKIGSVNLFEYDETLYAELGKSDLQMNFLHVASFFALYVPKLSDRANLAGLILTREVMMVPNEVLTSIMASYGLVSPVLEGLCNRSPLMLDFLERQFAMTCDLIQKKDLSTVAALHLVGEGANTSLFPHDFEGLTGVRRLKIEKTSDAPAGLNAKSFSSMRALETIELPSNGLRSVPCQLFIHAPHLHSIDLQNNNINDYPRNSFCGLFQNNDGREKTLDLSHNGSNSTPRKTTYFYPGAFEGMEGLTQLSLQNMSIGDMPEGVMNSLGSLTVLDLSINHLKDVSFLTSSKVSQTLVWLNLSQIPIKTFPEGFWVQFPNLEVLNMQKMSLHVLPDLRLLPRLRELSFCNRFLKEELPRWVQDLKAAKPQLRIVGCQ